MVDTPALGIAITVGTLYDRVRVTPRQGPRLVWDDEAARD
jgi:hypothetical protein